MSEVKVCVLTLELKNEFSALLGRDFGSSILDTIRVNLKTLKDGGTLALDFSMVRALDHSFIDEALVPMLSDLKNGVFGDRSIVGINFDTHYLDTTLMDRELTESDTPFLVITMNGSLLWLGAEEVQTRVLELVYSQNETEGHLRLMLGLKREELNPSVGKLEALNLIMVEKNEDLDVVTIIPKSPAIQHLRAQSEQTADLTCHACGHVCSDRGDPGPS